MEVFIVRELVSWVENFVSVHDLRTLIKISNCFLVVSSINLHYTSVEVVVFFVENILLVIIGFLCFFGIRFVVRLICALRCGRPCLKLPIELHYFVRVQVADVFEFVLFFLVRRLLDSEPEIISLVLAIFVSPVLFFSATDSSDLVDLGALGAWNHLRVVMLNR